MILTTALSTNFSQSSVINCSNWTYRTLCSFTVSRDVDESLLFRTRAQWLKAFGTAFEFSSPEHSQRYQRQLLEKRRIAREEEKDREEEEMIRTNDLGEGEFI